MADAGVAAGFVVLGLFILLIIAVIIVILLLVIKKLKYQHNDILILNNRIDKLIAAEKGEAMNKDAVVSRTKSKLKGELRADSAVDMDDTYSLSTNGNSVHGNEGAHVPSPRPVSAKIRPQYTIKIKNRYSHMFGTGASITQMVEMTQDFSCIDEVSDTVHTVDEMDIENVGDSHTTEIHSALSRQSIWQGRPTSILMQTPTTTPDSPGNTVSHENGVFIHKSVGKDGDTLTMSGVTLEIPPGALNESKLITFGITWKEALLPVLKKKQARLSPVVVCKPNLQFAKPVKLTFPHCGVQIINDWIPRVIKRQGDLDDVESEWTNLTLDDYEERDVTSSVVTVSLKHFTLYTLVGESKQGKTAAKKVKLIAFTPAFRKGAMFKTRIYCINDYETELEEVDKFEKRLDGSMTNAPVAFLFHDNEEDLTVTLKSDVPEWNLCGEKTQKMDFESVWHAMTPYCNFVFDPTTPAITKIYCEFESLQQTVGRKISLQISAEYVAPDNKLSASEDPRQELDRKLIILLDPKTNSDAGDFRDLASEMNLDGAHVTYLENQTNPTEQLLKRWRDEKKSLHELKKVLSTINRPDAVVEVEHYINKYLASA
ncbi:netrin receptor UNC5B-like [Ylistrum balloti]|uniref:netrin receptor UNC5B-like n=1 Tax=Ylistrum balloti TaxID=509963 RepID=UPI002905A0E5|nr:netrin receptor UNC5B-like [Ylistrum balloti]